MLKVGSVSNEAIEGKPSPHRRPVGPLYPTQLGYSQFTSDEQKQFFSPTARLARRMRYKSLLLAFWSDFDKTSSPQKRLDLLKQIAETMIRPRPSFSLRVRRAKFLANKYYRKWLKRKCRVCSQTPVIRHHIIQLQNGGNNSTKNIITICEPCHEQIHPWLSNKRSIAQQIVEMDRLYKATVA